MIPAPFDYLIPGSLEHALELLQKHGGDAKLLAGGQSLIPMMKLRLATPAYLVDLNRLQELRYIREEGGWLRLGPLTTEADLETSQLLAERYPILVETSSVIADPLVRNQATVGGNLAHGDPANDHPATMLALGAQVAIQGPAGSRTVAVEDFFRGLFQTALQPDEVLAEIQIPARQPRTGAAYVKLERRVGDFATAGSAAWIRLTDGTIEDARIGLTNVAAQPVRARAAEDALKGQAATKEVLRQAADMAREGLEPRADLRGSSEYRREMARVLTYRALDRALQRARGES